MLTWCHALTFAPAGLQVAEGDRHNEDDAVIPRELRCNCENLNVHRSGSIGADRRDLLGPIGQPLGRRMKLKTSRELERKNGRTMYVDDCLLMTVQKGGGGRNLRCSPEAV